LVLDHKLVSDHLRDLEQYVVTLRGERTKTLEELKGQLVIQQGIVHLVQNSVEAVANIAGHLIAECGLAAPSSYAESFRSLARLGSQFDSNLTESLVVMARFRNLAVHRYWLVDFAKVYGNLPQYLTSLERFASAVGRFLEQNPFL